MATIDALWDENSYTGYVIQYKDVTIYFAGDTGEHESIYKEIGNNFNIDLALIPVGPFRNNFISRGFRYVHLSPYAAIKAFKDTKAKYMLPIHHSTFYMRGNEELFHIKKSILQSGIRQRIFLLDIGQSITMKDNKVVVQGLNQLGITKKYQVPASPHYIK